MAFRREHITRFIEGAQLPLEVGEGIKERMEEAIAEFNGENSDQFSGNQLHEIIGNEDLILQFQDAFESQKLEG